MLQHQSMVFSIARRIVHDASLAEEVAQDVFFELYGQLHTLASDDHIVHWLRRVTVHRAIDQVRKQQRRPHQNLAISLDEPGAIEPAAVDTATSDPWVSSRLRSMVAALPIAPRTVIVLRYQEDMTPEEIASLLDMPIATVKSHLQRSLKLMRGKAQCLRN